MATSFAAPEAASQGAETTVSTPAPSLLDQAIEATANRYLPVMDIKALRRRKELIQEMKDLVLVEGEDFGVIPGTSKPTLLKPGAEKIIAFFGYVTEYEILPGSIEDWIGSPKTNGEPLFYYHIRCTLTRDGVAVGQGTGSCSTWESKYRLRFAERECPSCKKPTINRSKYEDKQTGMKGWYCHAKAGGCGEQFAHDDARIVEQVLGKVKNPEIFDVINTVQKMADKRAMIAAVLTTTGASQFFTQDLEDMPTHQLEQGSKEKANAVAQEKIENGGKKADVPPPPAAKKEELFGAHPDDPAELKDTMKSFSRTDQSGRLNIFSAIREALRNAQGNEEEFGVILSQFDVENPSQFTKIGPARECLRALWLALNRTMQSQAKGGE